VEEATVEYAVNLSMPGIEILSVAYTARYYSTSNQVPITIWILQGQLPSLEAFAALFSLCHSTTTTYGRVHRIDINIGHPVRPSERGSSTQPILQQIFMFYFDVHGEVNSRGRGCDEWYHSMLARLLSLKDSASVIIPQG
jgi:hypothetical protein